MADQKDGGPQTERAEPDAEVECVEPQAKVELIVRPVSGNAHLGPEFVNTSTAVGLVKDRYKKQCLAPHQQVKLLHGTKELTTHMLLQDLMVDDSQVLELTAVVQSRSFPDTCHDAFMACRHFNVDGVLFSEELKRDMVCKLRTRLLAAASAGVALDAFSVDQKRLPLVSSCRAVVADLLAIVKQLLDGCSVEEAKNLEAAVQKIGCAMHNIPLLIKVDRPFIKAQFMPDFNVLMQHVQFLSDASEESLRQLMRR